MAGEVTDITPLLHLVCAPKKLDRENGEERLRSLSFSEKECSFLCHWIVEKLDAFSTWEEVYGGLTVATILIQNLPDCQLQRYDLFSSLESRVWGCHENDEFRVRIAAGQLMGAICKRHGLSAFKVFLPHVVNGVVENIERNPNTPASEAENSFRELELARDRDVDSSRSSLSIFHDTAGWKHLETWMKCLQQMVTNLKPEDFVQIERKPILTLIFQAVGHTNRFVRETGYDVLATMILGHGCYRDPCSAEASYISVAKQLAHGLSDNWSQVRMAASRATRAFFAAPPPPEHCPEDVYPILIPPMCLNRYYVAEGVRIYSQETWKMVTKGDGKRLLGTYLGPAVEYYVQQSDADNHAVREAACASIAESVSKLDAELLRPYINTLLETLIVCFGDDSWPVRDAACGALGTLIATFPQETKRVGYKDYLAEQFIRNLSDSIPSVRDVAAYSIARVLAAASDVEVNQLFRNYIRDRLAELRNQPSESHGAESHRIQGKNPGVSHIISRSGEAAHDVRHTNQTMYSCGSLAPKLQKGRKGGGCHDGLNQRPSEPWERADGAIRLIGQIVEHIPSLFSDDMVDQMIEAASHQHYTHYPYFLETVCHVISQLAKGLEKNRFKRYLDNLLVVLSTAIQSDLPLAVVAGEETLIGIADRVGPNIIRSRISNHLDPIVVRTLTDRLPPHPLNA